MHLHFSKRFLMITKMQLCYLGNNYIRCRSREGEKFFNICVNTDQRGVSCLVSFQQMSTEYPPYKIVNNSSQSFKIKQTGASLDNTLHPSSTFLHVWDLPKSDHVLEVTLPPGCVPANYIGSIETAHKVMEYALDVVTSHGPLVVKTILPKFASSDFSGHLNVNVSGTSLGKLY
jgi:hypothetical protein